MLKSIGGRISAIKSSHGFLVGYHPQNPLMPKTFRKLVIGNIILFFTSAYSFSCSPMPKGSIIVDIFGDACHERKLASANADEDQNSTLWFSRVFFLSRLILSDVELLWFVGESFGCQISNLDISLLSYWFSHA
jgi:hypothetical protein